jgi:hypothetical protein
MIINFVICLVIVSINSKSLRYVAHLTNKMKFKILIWLKYKTKLNNKYVNKNLRNKIF